MVLMMSSVLVPDVHRLVLVLRLSHSLAILAPPAQLARLVELTRLAGEGGDVGPFTSVVVIISTLVASPAAAAAMAAAALTYRSHTLDKSSWKRRSKGL